MHKPETRVSELDLLSEEEREQILVQWNQTAEEVAPDESLVEVFEQQARRRPDAVAVESAQGALMYRQLDEQSNQLARYLRALGVGPEVVVGLCLERSV